MHATEWVASATGRPLELDAPATAITPVAGAGHLWRLQLSQPVDLRIVPTEAAADFRFYAYRPGDREPLHPLEGEDGSLVLELWGATTGQYQIIVYSPAYARSEHPYRLAVERVTEGEIPARPGPSLVAPAPGPYDGVWSPRTSTGSRFDLTVVGGRITGLEVDYGIRGNCCTVSGTRVMRLAPPMRAADVPFVLEQAVAVVLRFYPATGRGGRVL